MNVSLEDLRDLTFDAFVELPEELHKGAELFDGVIHVTSPIQKHQTATVEVLVTLRTWVAAATDRGLVIHDYLVRIDDRSGYKPDVAWYPTGSVPGDDVAEWHAVPGIAIEVLSPSTRRTDLVRKPGGYATIGVSELWLLDVDERSVLILRSPAGAGYAETITLTADDDTITSPLLPGFELAVADVFAD